MTGAGEGVEENYSLTVYDLEEIYNLCNEIEAKVNPKGSVYSPVEVLDESGTMFKGPAQVSSQGPSSKSHKRPAAVAIEEVQGIVDQQTQLLESILEGIAETNNLLRTLINIRRSQSPQNNCDLYIPQIYQDM